MSGRGFVAAARFSLQTGTAVRLRTAPKTNRTAATHSLPASTFRPNARDAEACTVPHAYVMCTQAHAAGPSVLAPRRDARGLGACAGKPRTAYRSGACDESRSFGGGWNAWGDA